MQCRGNSNKIQGGYIPFSAFDTPKVGTVHPNLSGKSFLRVALAAAQLAYLSADCNQLGVLWHIGKVRGMLCIGPRPIRIILEEWVWGKRPIDLIEHISQIAARIPKQIAHIGTEEATKTAFVIHRPPWVQDADFYSETVSPSDRFR